MSSVDPMNDYDIESQKITSIADFLAKPMPVATGQFTTANTWGDNLFTGDTVALMNSQAIWLNKLQGFLSMRGTVKLRLVINPTPFQCGLLRMSYFPCENQLVNEALAHRYNRDTISQLPGAYLSLQHDSVEISIPYVAPTSFIERDLIASSGHVSWGRVYIDVFEILRVGASSPLAVNWTLWMSVEDLELSGQIQPQSGRRVPRNVGDAESNSGRGPIARIMSAGTTLAASVSAIPSLAPLAKPAYWALAAATAAADALGWSKPTLTEGPMVHAVGTSWFSVNTDTNDLCMPLSLRADNKISVITDASPGSMDEMSFNYIKTRWAYTADFQWASTGIPGSLLYSAAVSPANLLRSYTVNSIPSVTAPPCAVFQEFFGQYRGSFEIRMRIVKTGFHAGTLAVGFIPGINATVPSFADTAYAYRQILDIQEGEEWCFNLPYLIPQDFLKVTDIIGQFYIFVVNPLLAPPTVSSTIDILLEVRGGPDLTYNVPHGFGAVPFVPQSLSAAKEIAGFQEMIIINPDLVLCFDEVPLRVKDYYECVFSGAEFTELWRQRRDDEPVSRSLMLCPHPGVTLFHPTGVSAKYVESVANFLENLPLSIPYSFDAPLEPQGLDTIEPDEASCVTLGAATHNDVSIHHASLSHGELMTSFEQFLKADWQLSFKSSISTAPYIQMGTHLFYGTRYNGTLQITSPLGADPISFVATWFAFHRGAMRWRFTAPSDAVAGAISNFRAFLLPDSDVLMRVWTSNNVATFTNWTRLMSSTFGGAYTWRMAQVAGVNGAFPIQAPFYSKYRYGLNHISYDATLTGSQNFVNNQSLGLSWANAGNVNFGRAIGDDFQFSYFVGIPLYCNAGYVFT